MSTPARRHKRKSMTSTSKTVKTPKDVRQLDRCEMIQYLNKYDHDIPNDIDKLRRSTLQKRVIHCMKQNQQHGETITIESTIHIPRRKRRRLMPQSAMPISKISKLNRMAKKIKKKNNKQNKRNGINNNKNNASSNISYTKTTKTRHINTTRIIKKRPVFRPRLITIPHDEQPNIVNDIDNDDDENEDDDIPILGLHWNMDDSDNISKNNKSENESIMETKEEEEEKEDILFDTNKDNKNIVNNVDVDKLLNAVRLGIPARYDIISLHNNPIYNGHEATIYRRSYDVQKLYEMSYLGHELECAARTMDDVYKLNDIDLNQIEDNVCEWVHKYGEYSSYLHPSIKKTLNHKLETKDYIFQYEVIGRFVGDEMTEKEFYEIYSGVFDEHKRLLHSWSIEITAPKISTSSSYDGNEDKEDEYYHIKDEQYEILIDCIGMNGAQNESISDILLIEDCRKDLTKTEMTDCDLKRENVLFITIEVNGWAGKFAIAKRDIVKNEILYGHYGDGYSSLKKKYQRQQTSVDYFVSSIHRMVKT